MIQRGGRVIMRVLDHVRQVTIPPITEKFIKSGTLINTDEYDIDCRLTDWGYEHKTVCHGQRRVCPRQGWRWISGSPRQHDGGGVVIAAKRVASPPGDFARTTARLRRFFPVCASCPSSRKFTTTKPRRSSRLHQPGFGIEPSKKRPKRPIDRGFRIA